MKYKLTAPHININKTAWLVTLAIAIILGTFVYGAVRKHQLDVSQAQATAAQASAVKAQQEATDKAFKQVQGDLDRQRAKAVTACGLLKNYSTATATKRLVSYPTICE